MPVQCLYLIRMYSSGTLGLQYRCIKNTTPHIHFNESSANTEGCLNKCDATSSGNGLQICVSPNPG